VSRRVRPPLVGALVALVTAPLLIAATIYASTGNGQPGTSEAPVAFAAPAEAPPSFAWATDSPAHVAHVSESSTVPAVAAAPRALVSAAPASAARDQKPSHSVTSSRAPKVMPLPAAPNF
jgi:hypothetical protein